MKAVQSKGIKLSSPGPRLVPLSQQAPNPRHSQENTVLALWPAMPGGISLLGHHCFFPALLETGKRTEVSLSQLPETSPLPHTLEGIQSKPSSWREIIPHLQHMLKDVHRMVTPEAAQWGNSWVGLEIQTLTQNIAQSPHFHLISLSQKQLRDFWFVTAATLTAALMPSTARLMPLVTCIGIPRVS